MNKLLRYFVVSVLLISLKACHINKVYHAENFSHVVVKENSSNDSAFKLIAPFKHRVDSLTQRVIAFSTETILKEEIQNALGNFVCDAMSYSGEKIFGQKPDLVIMNRGGMRSTLPKGEIKVLNIFELMPFDNELVILSIEGKKLREGLQTLIYKKHSYLGFEIRVNNKNEIIEVKVNGKLLDFEKNYSVLTSDYVANGGDKFDFLNNPMKKEATNLKIRDALINYCDFISSQNKKIIPYTDERLQISK